MPLAQLGIDERAIFCFDVLQRWQGRLVQVFDRQNFDVYPALLVLAVELCFKPFTFLLACGSVAGSRDSTILRQRGSNP
jgi:hypothetical protein